MKNFAKNVVSDSLIEAVKSITDKKPINEISDETKKSYAEKARKQAASGALDNNPEKRQKRGVKAAKVLGDIWRKKQRETNPPVSGDRGYGKGRYMGDSVEVDGNIIDEAKIKANDNLKEASGTVLGQNAEPDQSSTIDVNQKKKKKINELYKSTLHSYAAKAEKDSNKHEKDLDSGIRSGDADKANKAADKLNRRTAGLNRADDRLNKEEFVQEGAVDDMKKAAYNAGHKHAMAGKDYDKADMKKEWGSHFKHFESGHMNGVLDRKTQKNEEVEQIEEVLSPDATISDYIHDFVHSKNPKFAGKSKEERRNQAIAAFYAKKHEVKESTQIDEVSTETLSSYKKKAGLHASTLDKEGGKKNIEKANKRFSGIMRATLKQFDKAKVQKEDKDPAMDAGVGSDGQFVTNANTTSEPAKKKKIEESHFYHVTHDGVAKDHPDAHLISLFHGKKSVVNHITKFEHSAIGRASLLKRKGFLNVQIKKKQPLRLSDPRENEKDK